jgi:Spy/CpxP family protein refolding chaperone
MRILRMMPLAAVLAATLLAQTPGGTTTPVSPADTLKTYLSLTDAQVTALQQLRKQERQDLSATFQDLAAKQRALRDAVTSSKDAATIGQLQLDIEGLRKKIQDTQTSYQAQAVNSLTADQKTKLQALQAAAALQPAIRQAGALNLLAPPAGAGPGGAGAGPRFGAMGRGGARGGRF